MSIMGHMRSMGDTGRTGSVSSPMRVAFSTLAFPDATLASAVSLGRRWGYAGVELRLVDGELIDASMSAADRARVVSVASIGHLFSPVVFDDLHYRFRPYDQWTSYGQSKAANVLFAVGAAHRWGDDGIAVNALMPGNIASTALARHMGPDDLANFGETTELGLPPVKTIEQGAATSVLLAASPDVDGVTGRYYEDCAEAAQVTERGTHTGGVAPYALDPANADRLWEISKELTH